LIRAPWPFVRYGVFQGRNQVAPQQRTVTAGETERKRSFEASPSEG